MRRVRSGARSCVTGATTLLRGFPSFLRQPCRAPRSSRVTIDNTTQGPFLALRTRTPCVRIVEPLAPLVASHITRRRKSNIRASNNVASLFTCNALNLSSAFILFTEFTA